MGLRRKYIVIIALFSLFALTACEKNTPLAEEDSVTLTLRIGTSGKGLNADTRAYVDASQYEGIRTLRIIVTDPDKTEIYQNQKVTLNATEQNALQHTVTLTDIPVGQIFFYVIANEESIGQTYTDEVLKSADNIDNNKLFYKDVNYTYFPKKGPEIVNSGLPMSGHSTMWVDKNNTNVSVELERAVTKISLRVENATNSTITLNEVIFGRFFGDRLYIFPETNLDVPNDTGYDTKTYENVGFEIPANSISDPLSLYLYPTYAFTEGGTDSPYTIAIGTSVSDYQPQVFAPGINSFRRNTQVNILARITTTSGIELRFSVTEWENYTIDVPDFE